VQTFLPYASFSQSAATLDRVRLGKQRVEVLQILRAMTFPSYGWGSHPATTMWRGRLPALVAYGVAVADEWMSRGALDSTRGQILEFAPSVSSDGVELPSWVGSAAFHRAHQSNLLRKDSVFYGPRFPGVPDDLEYVWPPADDPSPLVLPAGSRLLVLRGQSELAGGIVSLGESSPSGGRGPKWRAQLELFRTVTVGTRIAALSPDGQSLALGTLDEFINAPGEGVSRRVIIDGQLSRTDFPYPALLQDPRSLFETVGPALPSPAMSLGVRP
jgi:Pyrimidine dimer DNA glycosylase